MLDFPNTSLKDIGISGVTGGSSSVLARKEVNTSNIYVPLKKRMMDKSFSSSKLLDTSTLVEIKQSQLNIKKVQVNLGTKVSNEVMK
jgi:hypothetical protein